jgi:hypothetical protein
MTNTTLDDVRPARERPQEAALRPSACEPPVRSELVATWSAEVRPSATWSVQARPSAALQRRLIAGLVG